jgi:hypothetical protein
MAASTQPQRIVVVVAGMHRSGTSALARALSLAGLALPTDVGGLWEPKSVQALDNRLLQHFGLRWHTPGAIAPERFAGPEIEAMRAEALEALRSVCGEAGHLVVKEPRMARLIPFWDPVFRAFGAEPRYVLAVRNPRDVASSLAARNETSLAAALKLWLDHAEASERDTRGAPRTVSEYETLLAGKSAEIERILAALAVPLPPLSAAARAAIDAYVSEDARHHETEREDLFEVGAASVLAATVHARLVDGTPPPDRRAAALGERLAAVAALPPARRPDEVPARPKQKPKRDKPAAGAAAAAGGTASAAPAAVKPKAAKKAKGKARAPQSPAARFAGRIRRLFRRARPS